MSSSLVNTSNPQLLQIYCKQDGNPIIKCIRNIRYEFIKDANAADYSTSVIGVIFISIRYHNIYKDYLERRIKEVTNPYQVRILLVHIDDENNEQSLQDLNRIGFIHGLTMLVGWSDVECARYLEALKEYEKKSSKIIQEKIDDDFTSQAQRVLTQIPSVNKTDAAMLLNISGSIANIMISSESELLSCPGLGIKKVKRLHKIFNEPFQSTKK